MRIRISLDPLKSSCASIGLQIFLHEHSITKNAEEYTPIVAARRQDIPAHISQKMRKAPQGGRLGGCESGLQENVSRNFMCAMVKSRYIGDGHPTFNRNPYNGYINPYYWVDDHPPITWK